MCQTSLQIPSIPSDSRRNLVYPLPVGLDTPSSPRREQADHFSPFCSTQSCNNLGMKTSALINSKEQSSL